MTVFDKERDIVVVSGLPRSGTSLMMQCLQAGGVLVATDGLRGEDEDNPRGYFELESVKQLRTSPGQMNLGELRGRAVKMAHPLLYWLPWGGPYRVIVMRRDLKEVIASQNIMLERLGKAAAEPEQSLAPLFERELNRLLDWLARRTDMVFHCVDYRDLVLNPATTLDTVSGFLGGGYDPVRMSEPVDPSLYRCRRTPATNSPDR
jgi:hypothetical protein